MRRRPPRSAAAPWSARASTLRSGWLAVVIALCLAVPAAVPAVAQDAASSDAVERRLRAVEEQRDGLSGDLRDAERRRARLAEDLSAATRRADASEAELSAASDAVDAIAAEVARLDATAGAARSALGGRLRELYKGAAPDPFLALLAGRSPAELTQRARYLSVVSRNDRGSLEAASASGRVAARRRAELAAAQAHLAAVATRATAARDELDRAVAAASDTENELRVALAEAEEQAGALGTQLAARREAEAAASRAARQQADAARAQEQAQVAAAVAAAPAAPTRPAAGAATSRPPAQAAPPAAPPARVPEPTVDVEDTVPAAPAVTAGGMACPQDTPRSFTDTWGAPRSGGRRHQGTDVFGEMGGDVFAITDGTVTTTKTGARSGLFLALTGDNGDQYWYMHLSAFVVRAGTRVSAGQLIARNGDTGNARGKTPHIHFELHPGGGGPINPYPLLRRVCG